MSRNKNNNVPWILYDFNRVADRRHEQRHEPGEFYFRDIPVGDKILTWFSDKTRDRN